MTSKFLFMGQQEDPEMDTHVARGTVRVYDGTVEPPCSFCGSKTAERSACPGCKKVFCRPCTETPYAFCCDGEP